MLSRRFLNPPIALLLVSAMGMGCAPSKAKTAVDVGNWGELRASIADDDARDALDLDDVRSLAALVASREIETASSSEVAKARIARTRACAPAVKGALKRRAELRDDAAAAALIALFEADLVGRSALLRYEDDATSPLRAAVARALVLPKDGELRRLWTADPDERVREQALRAALHAGDAEDRAAVLEAARLEPNPALRETAIRAAGAIGGERVVLGLADRWAQADEPSRRAIVEAWGMPKSIEAGGRAHLLRVVERETGSPAILAAATLARSKGTEAAFGVAALLRAMSEGAPRQRVLAIRLVPLDSQGALPLLRHLSSDADVAIRVAALVKLTESPDDRASSLDALAQLAEEGLAPADEALARAGDARPLPRLVEKLGSEDPSLRTEAGKSLIEAGEFRRAARLLGDDDASVRTDIACALLTATK